MQLTDWECKNMESLVNYGSEDDQDSDIGNKPTEAVTSEQGCSKSRTDDTNYDTIGMDLSEDSITINDDEGNSSPPNSQKEKKSKLKDKDVLRVAERHGVNYKKEEKNRNRPKERYKEERTRDKDKRKEHRLRKEYRRDRDDYRDRERGEYQDRERERGDYQDRDRERGEYQDRDREREYKIRTEKNSNKYCPDFRDRYRRSLSPRNKKERKSHQSKSKSRERSSVVRSPKENTNNKKDHEQKAITQTSSPPPTSIKNSKQIVPENKANASTVLPNYYNPNVINPNKYVEQVQKRKLLWSKKKTEDTSSKWENAKFAQDADGKVASKFMRLMGIKSAPKVDEPGPTISSSSESIKKREEMFSSMEQQYEVARQVTHTMRGVGLGFSSQSRQF